jgi:hypothetical protein
MVLYIIDAYLPPDGVSTRFQLGCEQMVPTVRNRLHSLGYTTCLYTVAVPLDRTVEEVDRAKSILASVQEH